MKKSLLLGILGLAAGVATSYGQGQITLDTYLSSSGVIIAYLGSPLSAALGLYVGMYYGPANNNINGLVAADPTGYADPMTLYSGFTLATGPGAVVNRWVGNTGQFINQLNGGPTTSFQIQPSGTTQNFYSLMLVVYNNAVGYDASMIRGHSAPWYMQAGDPMTEGSGDVGTAMDTAFGFGAPFFPLPVMDVPEPTTLALAGAGGLSLWLMRRKKN